MKDEHLTKLVTNIVAEQHKESERIRENGTENEWREASGNVIHVLDQLKLGEHITQEQLQTAVGVYNREIGKHGGPSINLEDVWKDQT